jgi:hypothetical protein
MSAVSQHRHRCRPRLVRLVDQLGDHDHGDGTSAITITATATSAGTGRTTLVGATPPRAFIPKELALDILHYCRRLAGRGC